MGIDLDLLPIQHDAGDWGYSHAIIPLPRIYALYDLIRNLEDAGPVPPRFSTYKGHVPDGKNEGEHGYGDTQEDPYGEKLRCVYAGDLGRLKAKFLEDDGDDQETIAALDYCAALNPMTRIALYWH